MNNERPKPREAAPEFLLLQHWEELTSWILARTARWPKVLRMTLTIRVENLVLEVLDELVQARYQKNERQRRLEAINLRLERLRFMLRIARSRQALSPKSHESLISKINESGRMLHGWQMQMKNSETMS